MAFFRDVFPQTCLKHLHNALFYLHSASFVWKLMRSWFDTCKKIYSTISTFQIQVYIVKIAIYQVRLSTMQIRYQLLTVCVVLTSNRLLCPMLSNQSCFYRLTNRLSIFASTGVFKKLSFCLGQWWKVVQ